MELFVALAAIKLPGLCPCVNVEKWATQQQLVIIMTQKVKCFSGGKSFETRPSIYLS